MTPKSTLIQRTAIGTSSNERIATPEINASSNHRKIRDLVIDHTLAEGVFFAMNFLWQRCWKKEL